MIIVKAVLVILVNLIIYFVFGSLVTVRSRDDRSLLFTVLVGFFAYYGMFALVTLPVMLTYRPLDLLVKIWVAVTVAVVLISAIFNFKSWRSSVRDVIATVKSRPRTVIFVCTVTILLVVMVCITYNFTLDAAYYVANVTTSVDTNMINVYDPFTGAWQDHFELRYVFATYSVNDAIICYITGIPALVETKLVMSAIVMILVNFLYVYIAGYFYENDAKSFNVMYSCMIFINLVFASLYSTSNFLLSRTYEGKSVVGNVAVLAVFAVFLMLLKEREGKNVFWQLFFVCLGTATISSTANMIIPAECFVLFVPFIFKNKKFGYLWKLALCVLPEIIMMLVYVLYVKGYFAIYTYPR